MTKVILDREIFKHKEVLVTGGAGFIGSHLVQALVNCHAEVTVVDNFSTGKLENLASVSKKLELIEGDIRKMDTLQQVGKVDIIFNEAAVSLLKSFKDPFSDLRTNVGGLINILEISRRYDAKLIHASTGSVYGNPKRIPIDEEHPLHPISPYGVSKLSAELYCKLYFELYGIDVTCLRYFNVYGPRQIIGEETGVIPIFVLRVLSGEPLTIFGNGLQTRDFLHVSDCVKANLLVAMSEDVKGLTINVGGKGDEIRILDLAYLVMKLSNKKTPIVFKDPKPGDIRRLVADISRAKTLLGYEPEVTLEQGLLDYIKYLKLSFTCKNKRRIPPYKQRDKCNI